MESLIGKLLLLLFHLQLWVSVSFKNITYCKYCNQIIYIVNCWGGKYLYSTVLKLVFEYSKVLV